MKNWVVYVVQCSDTTLYTGITNDLDKRIACHNSGKGAKYTRSRLPVELMACRSGLTRSDALKLELIVKRRASDMKIDFMIKADLKNEFAKRGW